MASYSWWKASRSPDLADTQLPDAADGLSTNLLIKAVSSEVDIYVPNTFSKDERSSEPASYRGLGHQRTCSLTVANSAVIVSQHHGSAQPG